MYQSDPENQPDVGIHARQPECLGLIDIFAACRLEFLLKTEAFTLTLESM